MVVGSGSDLSEEPVFRLEPVTLDSESFLIVLSGPPSSARCGAAGVSDEVAVDPVRDSSFQGPDRFFRCFAFGDVAVVVGAAFGVVAELGDGGDVDGVVEFAVASRVEPVPGPVTR